MSSVGQRVEIWRSRPDEQIVVGKVPARLGAA